MSENHGVVATQTPIQMLCERQRRWCCESKKEKRSCLCPWHILTCNSCDLSHSKIPSNISSSVDIHQFIYIVKYVLSTSARQAGRSDKGVFSVTEENRSQCFLSGYHRDGNHWLLTCYLLVSMPLNFPDIRGRRQTKPLRYESLMRKFRVFFSISYLCSWIFIRTVYLQ